MVVVMVLIPTKYRQASPLFIWLLWHSLLCTMAIDDDKPNAQQEFETLQRAISVQNKKNPQKSIVSNITFSAFARSELRLGLMSGGEADHYVCSINRLPCIERDWNLECMRNIMKADDSFNGYKKNHLKTFFQNSILLAIEYNEILCSTLLIFIIKS